MLSPEERIACARIVMSVILADAEITDMEREFLDDTFQDLGLTADERRKAQAGLDVGEGPGDISVLRSDEAKKKAVGLATAAMIVDGEAVHTERQIVADIIKQLGLEGQVPEDDSTRRVDSLRKP